MRKNSFIDQLKNLKHGQQLLAIFVLLLVLSVAWVFLGIFTGQQSSMISPAQRKAALPLTPQLDESVLQDIENKRVYTESELEAFPIYKVITINRGTEQTIVPIGFDESELTENSGRGSSLNTITAPVTQPDENQINTEDPPSDNQQSPEEPSATPPSNEPIL